MISISSGSFRTLPLVELVKALCFPPPSLAILLRSSNLILCPAIIYDFKPDPSSSNSFCDQFGVSKYLAYFFRYRSLIYNRFSRNDLNTRSPAVELHSLQQGTRICF